MVLVTTSSFLTSSVAVFGQLFWLLLLFLVKDTYASAAAAAAAAAVTARLHREPLSHGAPHRQPTEAM